MSQRLYEITITGEYYTKKAAGTEVASIYPYKVAFILPSLDSALAVIKGKLLNDKLKQVYDTYETYRTHSVTGVKLVTGSVDQSVVNLPINELTLVQLDDYCVVKRLFCDVYKAGSLAKARFLVTKLSGEQSERFNASAESRKAEADENELRRLNEMNIKQHGVEIPGSAVKQQTKPEYAPPKGGTMHDSEPSTPSMDIPGQSGPQIGADPSMALPGDDVTITGTAPVDPESDTTPLPGFLEDGANESNTSEAEG